MNGEKLKSLEYFEHWWAVNHPWDWWSKERQGIPLPHADRLKVWELCFRAFEAGARTVEHE
jgi:hypothetical protein